MISSFRIPLNPLDIFLSLLPNDVDHIVDGYAADEATLCVDDGECHQVVALHDPRDFLLVDFGRDRNRVGLDDVGEGPIRAGKEQSFQRGDTDQMSDIINDVDRKDGLNALGIVPDLLGRLTDGQMVGHRHEVGTHDTARSVFRVAEQALDFDGIFQTDQDGLGHFGRKVGQHVGSLIVIHFVEEDADLVGRILFEDRCPKIVFQFREDVRGNRFGEPFEETSSVVDGQVMQHHRDIGGIEVRHEVKDHRLPVGLDQRRNVLYQTGIDLGSEDVPILRFGR